MAAAAEYRIQMWTESNARTSTASDSIIVAPNMPDVPTALTMAGRLSRSRACGTGQARPCSKDGAAR